MFEGLAGVLSADQIRGVWEAFVLLHLVDLLRSLLAVGVMFDV